jgi:cell division protease FtsH
VVEEADIRADENPQMSRQLKFVFPLAVVVLLVYLASQTVLPNNGGETDIDYSQFLDFADSSPGSVGKVTFDPDGHRITAELRDGRTWKTHYTTDESAFALEQTLRSEHIRFDSRGGGDSAWWSILTYLLPFVLFFGFWIFLMRQVRGKPRSDEGEATQSGGISRY